MIHILLKLLQINQQPEWAQNIDEPKNIWVYPGILYQALKNSRNEIKVQDLQEIKTRLSKNKHTADGLECGFLVRCFDKNGEIFSQVSCEEKQQRLTQFIIDWTQCLFFQKENKLGREEGK